LEQRNNRKRRLAIFDIDGTLTATNAVDDECYSQAIGAVLDVKIAPRTWSAAPHISDAGLTEWLWQRYRDRSPTEAEVARTRSLFVHLLGSALRGSPARFAEVPGAARAVQHLLAHGWSVAIATGAWESAARLKLEAAGIPAAALPFASSDDAHERAAIVTTALRRAERMGRRIFERIVVLGDARWDVACALELELPFVGVGGRVSADFLRKAGASHVLENFLQVNAMDEALEAAAVPRVQSVGAASPGRAR
jgi:phosphoglycolate phosphatase-like HAD superfamily hydrolase